MRLNDDEIEKIVGTFQRKEVVEDFSVAVSYDEIKEKDILFLPDNISTSK